MATRAKRKPSTRTKAQRSPGKYLNSSISVVEGYGRNRAKMRPFSYDAAVRQFHSWCYSAASMNANAVAGTPLRLYVKKRSGTKLFPTRPVSKRMKRYLQGELPHKPGTLTLKALGEMDDYEEVMDHPVLDLLRTVNLYENGYNSAFLRVIYQQLTGNAYLHPVIGPAGVPDEIWTMPSQWVWIIPDRQEFIRGFIYGSRPDDNQVEFARDEIIHFKYPNPGNLFYGLGKVEACWAHLGIHNSKTSMDTAVYDNMARPDFVVAVKGGATQDALERYETTVNAKLRGTKNSGKHIAMSGDVAVIPLNWKPIETGDAAYVVEIIASVFGVPVAKLKANQNVAGGQAEVSDGSYMKDTVHPLTVQDAEVLNANLLPMFDLGEDAVLCYDDVVPRDKIFERDTHVAYVNAGIESIAEVRSELGLDEVPGTDELRIGGMTLAMKDTPPEPSPAFGMLSLDGGSDWHIGKSQMGDARITGANSRSRSSDKRGQVDGNGASVAVEGEADGRMGGTGSRTTDCGRDSGGDDAGHDLIIDKAWELHCKDTTPQGRGDSQEGLPDAGSPRGFAKNMNAILQAQIAAAITQMRTEGVLPSMAVTNAIRVIQEPQWIERISKAAKPFLGRAIEIGGKFGMEKLGDSAMAFDVTNPQIQKFVDNYSVRLANGVNQFTEVSARKILGDGLAEGESTQQLIGRVKDWAGEEGDTTRGTGARAENIARTESSRAYVQGEQEAWKQSGIVEGKQWLLAADACPFCEAAAKQFEGKTIALEQAFFTKGHVLTAADGATMTLDYEDVSGPPLHPQCRCDVIPILIDQP